MDRYTVLFRPCIWMLTKMILGLRGRQNLEGGCKSSLFHIAVVDNNANVGL